MIRWDDHEPGGVSERVAREVRRHESDLEMARRLPDIGARHVTDTAGTPAGKPRAPFASGHYSSATRVWTLYLRTRDAWIRATRMGHASDRVLATDEAEKAEAELYEAICPVLYPAEDEATRTIVYDNGDDPNQFANT